MTEYKLYLESGPKHKTTMVHVLDLLGCIAQGATTEQALENTPEAIRTYLCFLQRHGEVVDPEGAFSTQVAEHVTEGPRLGYGNPAPGFAPDFRPLPPEDLETYLRCLNWLHAELLQRVAGLSREVLEAKPQGRGRTIAGILDHVVESEGAYIRSALGKVEALSRGLKAYRQGPEDLSGALSFLWQVMEDRLGAMSEAERRQEVPHGQVTWTARRAMRRLLEHDWEHLLEIEARLGS